jgi:RNA polymerase sigma factor (sigma-70 family)
MSDDRQLLRRFVSDRSEAAFGELVARHVTLVYSAALRQTGGDAHRAQDIAQIVFTDFARKAPALSENVVLAGWLHRATIFAARQILRGERRRRAREQEAVTMNAIQSETENDGWKQIRPLLDEALERLNKTDRDALLLRFFEQQSLAQVGTNLGGSEDAARKRINRALEKLRAILTRNGVTTTAAALSTVISANAIEVAPAGLAASLTNASLAVAGTGTAFTFFKIMTMTKLKLGISALVIAGAATAFVLQHQMQIKLREENESLRQQMAQLQTDNESLSNRLAAVSDSKKLTDDQFNELLKLRGEVTLLRHDKNVLPEATQSKTNSLPVKKTTIQIHLRARFVSLPTEDLPILGVGWTTDAQGGRTGLLAEQQLTSIIEALNGASDANVISAPQVVTINGEHAIMSITRKTAVFDLNGDGTLHSTNISYVDTGTILEVTPYFSTNSSTFDLNLNAKLIQLADSSQTNLQTLEVTNHISLQPGQTVVLEKEIPPGGWLDDSTNATTESRSLLMFVTPQVVDSRGFVKFPPPQSPPNQ